jgi:hypothetical protein
MFLGSVGGLAPRLPGPVLTIREEMHRQEPSVSIPLTPKGSSNLARVSSNLTFSTMSVCLNMDALSAISFVCNCQQFDE